MKADGLGPLQGTRERSCSNGLARRRPAAAAAWLRAAAAAGCAKAVCIKAE